MNQSVKIERPSALAAQAWPTSIKRRNAVDLVLADETLRTAYLLNNPRASDPALLTNERAARFLLWFATEGRLRYQHVSFSPSYLAFLADPVPPYPSRLAAYLMISRADLRTRFAGEVDRYHAWYYDEGVAELGLAPLVSAQERIARAARQREAALSPSWLYPPAMDRGHLPGINIIGFGHNVMGIGEDVRALAAALSYTGIPHVIVSVPLADKFGTSTRHEFEAISGDRPIFPINIFALPLFEMARLRIEHGANWFHGRYSIGYWPWELTSFFPEHWRSAVDTVDEVWASSEFLHEVYQRLSVKPVYLMPPYLNLPPPAELDLVAQGIASRDIVFLAMCDLNSFPTRKNPEGAIAAFRRAFTKGGCERLIIKVLNAHGQAAAVQRLKAEIGDDDRIILLQQAMTRAETAGLIRRADGLISLHRAEGFGRVIAEAMALGTPVIATNWSGNTSYLDETRGYPVAFSLRDVAAGEYVFHHGSQWAEPSIEDAAMKLCQVRESVGRPSEKSRRAMSFIQSAYGLDTVALKLADRIGALASARPELFG